MAPKAAFQFGVKVAGGRKKDLNSKGRDAKEKTQLSKIQQILEKDGGDFGVAFGTAQQLDVGGGDAAPVKSKRRRI